MWGTCLHSSLGNRRWFPIYTLDAAPESHRFSSGESNIVFRNRRHFAQAPALTAKARWHWDLFEATSFAPVERVISLLIERLSFTAWRRIRV